MKHEKNVVKIVNPAYEAAIEEGQTELYDLPIQYIYKLENIEATVLDAVIGALVFQLDYLYNTGAVVVDHERTAGPVSAISQFLHLIKNELNELGHGHRFEYVLNRLERNWQKKREIHQMTMDGTSEDEIKKRIGELFGNEEKVIQVSNIEDM